jgi:glycosyltransferase involved in cell wall biosynthesis
MAKEGTPQQSTWNFLNKSIVHADIFVSHPILGFIPKNVPKNKVVLMPATTDFLDGLNKELSSGQTQYYQQVFNQELLKSGQSPLSVRRPYIIQVARFDPSKGLHDVLEAYRRLRKRLMSIEMPNSYIPQLVIVGNGAVDDPEGGPILQEIHFLLEMDRYRHIRSDVKVARVPHIDQMLNALLSESMITLQLSHREGFEVKVTEALHKGRPVVAYRTGGIPLQIRHGQTGYLVRTGDTRQVSKYLFRLMTEKMLYAGFQKRTKKESYSSFGTVANATRWLFLVNALLAKKKFYGHGRTVDSFLEARVQ